MALDCVVSHAKIIVALVVQSGHIYSHTKVNAKKVKVDISKPTHNSAKRQLKLPL